jgi:hypothetical protein
VYRKQLVVLQDRGYFRLTAGGVLDGSVEGADRSEVAKTLQTAGVRFFGTAKESKFKAFRFADNDSESGLQWQLQINTFGARSSFVASANTNQAGKDRKAARDDCYAPARRSHHHEQARVVRG